MQDQTIDVTAHAPRTQAESLYRAGSHAAAEALLGPLVEAQPPDPATLRLLGLCRLRLGDPVGGVRLLARARALTPEDPVGALHLGIGLQAVGQLDEAASLFRVAASGLPDDAAPLINLAGALLALNDPQQALRASSDACFRAPSLAEAHYTYGLAWLACNGPPQAERAFAAAVRLAPGMPDAWVNLGLARYRQGDMNGATVATRQALRLAPGHRGAAGNLGAWLRLSGDAEAGETILRDLLSRDPEAAEARLNLAAALLLEERATEALAVLDAPVPTEPRLRWHFLAQTALALLLSRRPAQARTVLEALGDTPAELRPLLLWRRVLLKAAEGDHAAAREQATLMEMALEEAGAAMVPEHRIMAHFDLAKFWSGQALHDRAFPHWVSGHRLVGQFQPFSREACLGFVNANIAAFDRQRFRHGKRAQNDDPAPVFIVGMPRSGTTLCEQILAAHGRVHGAGERPALGQAFARLAGTRDDAAAPGRIADLDGPALDEAAAAYLAELHALAPGAARVVDKMPGNFSHLGLVGLMLPGARIIHCRRDPRDIGLSIFTFRFHGHHPYAHDLGNLGWYIGQHDQLMTHWRDVLPNPILSVALSDWVEDFSGTLARVLAFLDLPGDPACARFHESKGPVRTVSRSQVRRPVNASGLGRWRTYERHLEPLVAELQQAGLLDDAVG